MAKTESFRVKNLGALKDVTLGKLWKTSEIEPLTPLTAVIGKNGTGTSTLFDAFGFLADALKYGVEDACDARGRDGFEKIRTLGQSGPIEFEVYYRDHSKARPITHELAIGTDGIGRPYVQRERYFIDALEPKEVWSLEKGDDGYSTIRRASDEPLVNNLVAEGLRLDALWYSEYLDAK